MLINGVNIRVYNIHSDSTSDALPPTYEVYEDAQYLGHCFQASRQWRWGTPDGETGTASTRRQCLTALIARRRGEAGSDA